MGTTIESGWENEQVKAENKKLRRELRETRQAAIFSAVELLHRLGVSGDDAEKMWRGERSTNAIVLPNASDNRKPVRAFRLIEKLEVLRSTAGKDEKNGSNGNG